MQPLTTPVLASASGAPPALWKAWSFDPPIVCGLLTVGLAYGRGLRVLWARRVGRGIPIPRAVAFAAGMTALAAALLSPLDALDGELLTIHMAQHMVLILVAAPLLVLGAPGLAIWAGLPADCRHTLAHWRRSAVGRAMDWLSGQHLLILLVNVAVLWAWHLPVPYQAALVSPPLHALEHASFLGAALLFWRAMVGNDRRHRLDRGPAILYAFVTAMQAGALGALLTFAAHPLYPRQALDSVAWGLTPLADQQLAGIVMWVPGGAVYLGAAVALLLLWLAEMEAESRRREGSLWTGHREEADALVGLDAPGTSVERGERR